MNKRRITKVLYLLGIIVFSLSFLATSCKEEADNNQNPTPTPTPQNKFYGKWKLEVDSWQAYNDTIFFDSDYFVKNYFRDGDVDYSFSNDTIYFNPSGVNYPIIFTLENDTLILYKFGHIFSTSADMRHDLMFTRIK